MDTDNLLTNNIAYMALNQTKLTGYVKTLQNNQIRFTEEKEQLIREFHLLIKIAAYANTILLSGNKEKRKVIEAINNLTSLHKKLTGYIERKITLIIDDKYSKDLKAGHNLLIQALKKYEPLGN